MRPDSTTVSRVLGTVAALAVASCLAAPASAHSYHLGAVEIGHLWVKPTDDLDGIAGVYGAILNTGDEAVTLQGVSSPAAERAGFCVEAEDGATWTDTAALAPKLVLAFAPWRQHICLTGLKAPLVKGQTVPLTLDFGEAGKVEAEAMIEPAPSD